MSVNKVNTSSSASTVSVLNKMREHYASFILFVLNFTSLFNSSPISCYRQAAMYCRSTEINPLSAFSKLEMDKNANCHIEFHVKTCFLFLITLKFQWIYTMCQKHIGHTNSVLRDYSRYEQTMIWWGTLASCHSAAQWLLVPMQWSHSPTVQGGWQEWPESAATVAKVFQCEWWLQVTVVDHLSLCR